MNIEDTSTSVYEYVNNYPVKPIGFSPEEYGFKLVKGDGNAVSVWKSTKKIRGNFILTRYSHTLFVLRKQVKFKEGETFGVKLVTKWHMIIDRKELADIYFNSGLRG